MKDDHWDRNKHLNNKFPTPKWKLVKLLGDTFYVKQRALHKSPISKSQKPSKSFSGILNDSLFSPISKFIIHKNHTRSLTLIHKNRSGLEIFMSLNYAFLNAINKRIEWLTHKSKRCHNVHNILKIAPRTSMRVNATDSNIILSIKVPIPAIQAKRLF